MKGFFLKTSKTINIMIFDDWWKYDTKQWDMSSYHWNNINITIINITIINNKTMNNNVINIGKKNFKKPFIYFKNKKLNWKIDKKKYLFLSDNQNLSQKIKFYLKKVNFMR